MGEIDFGSIADEFGIKGLAAEDGVATLTTAPTTEQARDLVLAMSLALGKMLDDDQATNYVETEIKKAGHPAYVLNVRRAMGKTPHELRREAEGRVSELEAQIDRVRKVHEPIDAVNYGHRRPQHTQVCSGCGTDAGNWQVYPCPTIRALKETSR